MTFHLSQCSFHQMTYWSMAVSVRTTISRLGFIVLYKLLFYLVALFQLLFNLYTFFDVKSSGELFIRLLTSSKWDGDEDLGGEGDGEILDDSDLWILLLLRNSSSLWGWCLLLIFRKTRREVCWLGLLDGGESLDLVVVSSKCFGEDGSITHVSQYTVGRLTC